MIADVTHYTSEEGGDWLPLDEARAREILAKIWLNLTWLREAGGHESLTIQLDGNYDAEQLEAIAWWMRHKGKP